MQQEASPVDRVLRQIIDGENPYGHCESGNRLEIISVMHGTPHAHPGTCVFQFEVLLIGGKFLIFFFKAFRTWKWTLDDKPAESQRRAEDIAQSR